MRYKKTEIMEKIVEFVNDYHRLYGSSPSTTQISQHINFSRGTAYKYLIAMRERGMIQYDGRSIVTNMISLVNHDHNNAPIVGRVVCGDATEEEENIKEYIDLPPAIFGNDELFILEAYGDSMNLAGINEGDYVVVKKQSVAKEGNLVIALTNGENNLKRISFDNKNKKIILIPESDNPKHKPKEYDVVDIQGIVTHIIKRAK